MNKRIIFIITAITLFITCKNTRTNSNTTVQTDSLEVVNTFSVPDNAVPIVYRGHIYIPSEIDSIQGNILFDSGASGGLYLDSTFFANNPFRKFNFLNGYLPGAGSGKPQKVNIITDTVSYKFNNYEKNISFIPIFLLKPILGDFADGILGLQYFKVLEINYLHEYIILHDKINTVNTSEYVKIKMKKENNQFLLPVSIQINNDISINEYFLLDLGSGGSISLTSTTSGKYKLHENITEKVQYFTKYGGVSGESSSCDFRANSIKIGDYKLEDVVMDYSEDKSGSLSNSYYAGLVGNELLEKFDVIIDFVNNDLYLKPNQNFDKPFNFGKRSFGYVDRSITMNAWIVTGLYKNRNAEIAGLKIDDKIISVNGIDIHKIPYKEQMDFWKKTDKVTLTVLRNNEEKIIEFDLKYVL